MSYADVSSRMLFRRIVRSAQGMPNQQRRDWIRCKAKQEFAKHRNLIDPEEIAFARKLATTQLDSINVFAAHLADQIPWEERQPIRNFLDKKP